MKISNKSEDLEVMEKKRNHQETANIIPLTGKQMLAKFIHEEQFLPTGTEDLDTALGGGLLTGELTELFGLPATGKTQLCVFSAVNIASVCKCNVLYIDTKGCFSEERVRDIVNTNQHYKTVKEKQDVLSHVLVKKIYDLFALIQYLTFLDELIKRGVTEWCRILKLIIIDSVASVILPNLGGNQIQGQALMSYFSHLVRKIAIRYSISILVVNNAVRKPSSSPSEDVIPTLGKFWSSIPHIRILCMLSQEEDGSSNFKRKVVKSNR